MLPVGEVDRADRYDAADRARDRLGIEVNPVVRTAGQRVDPSDTLVAQIKASVFVVVLDNREPVVA